MTDSEFYDRIEEKIRRRIVSVGASAAPLIRGSIEDIVRDAMAEERKECCEAIRSECVACDDGVAGVAPDGSAIECEYCGRPMAIIRNRSAAKPPRDGEGNADVR